MYASQPNLVAHSPGDLLHQSRFLDLCIFSGSDLDWLPEKETPFDLQPFSQTWEGHHRILWKDVILFYSINFSIKFWLPLCCIGDIHRTNILAPIPEISIFFISWPIDIWAVKPACYLIDLLCWSRTAIQSRGTIWAHKVLAFHLALGEWIGTWDVNGEAIVNLLSVIPLLKTAAVQLLIERNMSNVMVNKLPKLHHHHCGWCGGTFNPFPQCVGYFPDWKWIWIYRILLLQYHTKQFQRYRQTMHWKHLLS